MPASTINELIDIFKSRLETEVTDKTSIKFLRDIPPEQCILDALIVVYLYTRVDRGSNKVALFSEIVLNIGRRLRKGQKVDTALEVRAGAFLLYNFEILNLIKVVLGQGKSKHATYIVDVVNDDLLAAMWSKVDASAVDKVPFTTEIPPWTASKHQYGAQIVKTRDLDVLRKLTPATHPIVFDCVNKAQAVGWVVNEPMYNIFAWSIRNKTDAFKEIWTMQSDEARASKLREVDTIGRTAAKMIGKTFYHLHTLDFRGRLYCSTAYLNHQSTDLAKGLLLRADSAPIGKQGFFWLLVSIANYWAGNSHIDGRKTDKIPMQERASWALDNEEILLSYALSPKVNSGWHKADSPWQFLAACMELKKLREWQVYARISLGNKFDEYAFESNFTGWLDGSTNGIQHLSALTRDETVAPYANLTPSEFPGDLYAYVAEHVWKTIAEQISKIPKEEIGCYEEVIDNLAELQKEIGSAERHSDKRRLATDALHQFREDYSQLIKIAAPLFWNRITDKKERRKISKRGVMTISYGSTAYGMGSQVIDDARKHGIDALQHIETKFGAYMGRLIFEDCRVSLNRPMKLLSLFEEAGTVAEERKEFLKWKLPITDFPVVQHYVEGDVKKVWVQYYTPAGLKLSNGYYENTFQIAIAFNENPVYKSGKQKSGAAPNIVHSLDAAHLMLVVHRADFPVTTVHDSFGCLLGDMDKLFRLTRETFVELYETDPLTGIMKNIKVDIARVDRGRLDIRLVLESEYAFS